MKTLYLYGRQNNIIRTKNNKVIWIRDKNVHQRLVHEEADARLNEVISRSENETETETETETVSYQIECSSTHCLHSCIFNLIFFSFQIHSSSFTFLRKSVYSHHERNCTTGISNWSFHHPDPEWDVKGRKLKHLFYFKMYTKCNVLPHHSGSGPGRLL